VTGFEVPARRGAWAWSLCALALGCYHPHEIHLVFASQPGPAVAGEVMDTVRVGARDEFGNAYAGYVGAIHLKLEGTSATLCGGDTPSSGVGAAFTTLVIDRPAVGVRFVAEAAEASPGRSAPFDVVAPAAVPEVGAFACEPPRVPIGGTGTLSWSVSGASEAEILPIGAVPPSGSVAVAPYADGGTSATFELLARATDGLPLRVRQVVASTGGGAGSDALTAVDAFPDGSAIAVGSFEVPAQFGGPLEPPTDGGVVGQRSGTFIARLRPDGGIAWSRVLAGPGASDAGAAAAAGPDGSAFLLESRMDHFAVASLDADGGVIWERPSESAPPGEHHFVQAGGIAALPGGGVAVAATSGGALRLASDGPDALLLDRGDAGFGVLAVHAPDGGLSWGRASGSSLSRIAAQPSGGIYALGTYTPQSPPGDAAEPGCADPPSGSFVGRYAPDGGIAWVQCLPPGLTLDSLAAARDDAVVAAGYATGSFRVPPSGLPVDAGGPGVRAMVVRWETSGALSSAMLLPDRGTGPPGQAWAVAALPDGSILVGASNPGASRREFVGRYDRSASLLAAADFSGSGLGGGVAALPGGGFWVATSYRGAIGNCGTEQRSIPGSDGRSDSIDALALRFDPVNFRLLEVRPP
jgi:hypothetical protein